ncbi:MAG: ROK family protein [Bacteroidales bacterium]|nr:ROK family protein [Bacteroidales bacterium]
MKSIVLDLGGTNIKNAIVQNDQLDHVSSFPFSSKTDFNVTMQNMTTEVDSLINSLPGGIQEINGIGLAIPGIVNVHDNRVISINKKHEEAIEFDFNGWVKKHWDLPLVMDNDARAALIGEWKYGAGQGYNHIVMVTLGTGVGGAAMINGRLIYGKHFQAGCLGGHFIINFRGRPCTCGNVGCVESEASGWVLPELTRKSRYFSKSDKRIPDFKELFERYQAKDPLAMDVIHHCRDAWSAGIISLIHAYDPEIVIIGGGIMESGEYFLSHFQEKVDKLAWTPMENVKIVKAQNINASALLGLGYMLKGVTDIN